jgi:hypothetical protein
MTGSGPGGGEDRGATGRGLRALRVDDNESVCRLMRLALAGRVLEQAAR